MPKVLIVEDDEVIAQGMARHLGAAGFDPVSVGNGTQGLALLRYEKPDVCVLHLMLPGVDGWKLIETARNEGIGTPIVRSEEHTSELQSRGHLVCRLLLEKKKKTTIKIKKEKTKEKINEE